MTKYRVIYDRDMLYLPYRVEEKIGFFASWKNVEIFRTLNEAVEFCKTRMSRPENNTVLWSSDGLS